MSANHGKPDADTSLIRDDEPLAKRLSWSNVKAIGSVVAVGAAAIAAISAMQNQIAEIVRRTDRIEAVNHVQDSMLTIINYERANGIYAPPRAQPRHLLDTELARVRSPRFFHDVPAPVTVGDWFKNPYPDTNGRDRPWIIYDHIPRRDTDIAGTRLSR